MKNVNLKALLVATIFAAITFIILEFVLESAFSRFLNISENRFYEQFRIEPAGSQFHVLNFLIFFLEILVIIYAYSLIRSKFSSNLTAALITSGIFLAIVFLILANFTNLGILTPEMSGTSLFFSLLELPPSIIVGAEIYGEGQPK